MYANGCASHQKSGQSVKLVGNQFCWKLALDLISNLAPRQSNRDFPHTFLYWNCRYFNLNAANLALVLDPMRIVHHGEKKIGCGKTANENGLGHAFTCNTRCPYIPYIRSLSLTYTRKTNNLPCALCTYTCLVKVYKHTHCI